MGSSISGLHRLILNNRTKVLIFPLVSSLFIFVEIFYLVEIDDKDVGRGEMCFCCCFVFQLKVFIIDGVAINLTKYCAIVKGR